MEQSNPNSESSLETRWQNVMRVRDEYASELHKMSTSLPGAGRKHLRKLSNWFKRPTKLDEALKRPDILAVCLPLLTKSQTEQASLSATELEQAARLGFCSLGRDVGYSRRLLQMFLYPILILLATIVLAIGFSFFLAPQFQEMFAEFGIELPYLTKLVINVSEAIRHWWWAILAVPLLACFLIWALNFIGQSSRPGNLSWIDHRLMSTRNALACWAWHVAMLMEAGVGQHKAVETAGGATGNSWIRHVSLNWDEKRNADQDQFSNHQYQLLSNAMQLPPSQGKIAALRQIAAYYWDRNRNTGDWWIHLLIALFLWIVGIVVFCTIVSLFMPLIAIVSGLTSSK